MTDTTFKPVPREDCPERCQGHYAPCEHATGFMACDPCIAERAKNGPVFCTSDTET